MAAICKLINYNIFVTVNEILHHYARTWTLNLVSPWNMCSCLVFQNYFFGYLAPCARLSWPQSVFIARCYASAMLCIRGTSHGPVSVRPSVCLSVRRSFTKTAKRRVTQTTPHDSPVTLVFWRQRSPRNSTGITHYRGAKCRWGGSKSASFNK